MYATTATTTYQPTVVVIYYVGPTVTGSSISNPWDRPSDFYPTSVPGPLVLPEESARERQLRYHRALMRELISSTPPAALARRAPVLPLLCRRDPLREHRARSARRTPRLSWLQR